MPKVRNIDSVIMIMLVCLLSLSTASAQSTTATLSGTVMDPSGAVVPGAAVIIVNPATGFTREIMTNDEGVYTFPSLTPGTYTVSGRRQGFSTAEIKDVVLNVNDKRSLQIQLTVGDVGATVQVTAEPSLVDESPAVATTIDRQFVENLPLNGRSFQGLIALSPGVVITGTGLEDQGQFSVNGQRTASNSFSVDGVSANFGGVSGGGASLGQFAGGALPAFSAQGGTNSLVSVDAVQEFTIQTSTYAPEFGRTPGAQISILTRSGTNKFNGSVFEYFRDEALDANDWFANSRGLPKPPLRVNNYGGVIGGPLYLPNFGEGGPMFISGKDRTFFFFSYEAQPFTLPQTRLTHVPTLAFRQAAPAALRPFLNSYPLPNGPVLANQPLLAEFNAVFADRSDLNTYSVRVDHNFTSRFQLFGRFSDSSSNRSERAGASVPASNIRVSDFKTRTLTFGNTWLISNALVNDLRVNYSTHKVTSLVRLDDFGGAVPVSSAAFFTTPQPFTEENSFFTFNLIGGNNLIQNFGKGQTNEQKQLNIVDNFSVVKGSHSFKFGGDYRRLLPIYDPREYQAVTAHASPGAVLLDSPLLNIIQADRSGTFSFNNLGLYGQDTWKVSPQLTLTYGLRWDVDFAPTFGGLQPLSATNAGFDDPTKLDLAPEGTPIYKTTYINFAPRVGIAYQLRQKAGRETVLLGGFGVFYDLASQGVGQQIRLGTPPFGNQKLILGPSIGGNAIFPLPPDQAALPAIGRFPPFISLPLFDPELKLPYTLQWNAAVEQSLGVNQSFTAAYVAAAGRRLLRQRLISGNVTPPGAVTPLFSNPSLIDNTSTSDYHSMQLQFQRRLSQGLQALASYTWAHSIDTASTGQSSIADARLNFNDVNADRGNSNFDIRHTFNAAVSYEIPALFENAALRAILGGWALDNIFTSRSAPPLTLVSTAGTFSSSGAVLRLDRVPGVPLYLEGDQFPGGRAINRTAFTAPPLDAAGNPIRQGTLGRNSVRGFGAWQLDTSLRRQFKFTERVKLQLRADFFNIFNHPNFGQPITNFQSATFGRATNMLGRSLGGGSLAGGFNPLFQIGGPRSTQLSVKLLF